MYKYERGQRLAIASKRILWHSVCLTWNSVDLRRKYTRRTQDGRKRPIQCLRPVLCTYLPSSICTKFAHFWVVLVRKYMVKKYFIFDRFYFLCRFFSRFFYNEFFLVARNLHVLHRISPYLSYFQISSGSETALLYLIILANQQLEIAYSAFCPFCRYVFFFRRAKGPLFHESGS